MNLPGTLRHSKSHRAAIVCRAGKMRRFEISIPAGRYAADLTKLFTLPPGAVVQAQFPDGFVVDIPMGSVMDVRHEVQVKAMGVVPARRRPHMAP
jgi:hypothetical protein